MKADYVHKDTRTIVVDGVEIQTSLTAVEIASLKQENQELKKQLEEVEFIVGLRQKRNLIHKFDKEYDEEDKNKNPNRDYAGIMPDAEEIYRRYYTMKNKQKEFINYLEDKININPYDISDYDYEDIINTILSKYKEIIGVSNEY